MVKVIFIGGFAYGKIVYDYLRQNRFVALDLSITYPDNTSNSDSGNFPNDDKLIKDVSANKYLEAIQKSAPDFIFVSGWSELLNSELIQCAKKGTIGFHPSKLPDDRGRSVLAWQIEEGYKTTALSMFYFNDMPDCGDIIAQEKITIDFEDTIKDVLAKVGDATYNLMKAYFPLIREGKAPRLVQDIRQGNFRRLRKERDSEIDWNKNSLFIYNKVRAITYPYPGAIAIINNDRYKIWKCKILNFPLGEHLAPGSLVGTLFDNSLVIKTRNGFIQVIKYERI
ncbi:MAG: methionyl-tRNA formyltransferase [Flavisolibacter sp.]